MHIICDCGSTKADWLIIQSGRDKRLENTAGFSPFFHTASEIEQIIHQQLAPHLDCSAVKHVWFYGTGIHDASRADIVRKGIGAAMPNARIDVWHDLLGSARATCGNSAGIACILGTGSNSCYYDGNRIADNVPSLGWLLGDEGSGTHLGKSLLRAAFYRELPRDLEDAFDAAHPEGLHHIKDKVYEKGGNTYLASFTAFMGAHKEHPFIKDLVRDCLSEFLDRHIVKYNGYKKLPIHFVGSIAHHFEEVLRQVMQDRGMQLGNVVRKPIFALADYHVGKEKLEM
jgi:glucosamine kinase